MPASHDAFWWKMVWNSYRIKFIWASSFPLLLFQVTEVQERWELVISRHHRILRFYKTCALSKTSSLSEGLIFPLSLYIHILTLTQTLQMKNLSDGEMSALLHSACDRDWYTRKIMCKRSAPGRFSKHVVHVFCLVCQTPMHGAEVTVFRVHCRDVAHVAFRQCRSWLQSINQGKMPGFWVSSEVIESFAHCCLSILFGLSFPFARQP